MTRTARRVFLSALLLAPATAGAAPAASDDEAPAVKVAPPPPGTGYHLQMIAVDAASFGTAMVGFAMEGDQRFNPRFSEVLQGAGMGGYALGGPIIHLTHRQWGRAALSLAARVGLPLLGAGLGAWTATCSPDEWFCGLNEAATGFAIGAAAAAVVDAAFIVPPANASTPDPATVAAAPRSSAAVRLSPRLVATPNVAVLGVGGQF